MVAAIASVSVQSLGAARPDPARLPPAADPLVGTPAQRAEAARHSADAAAIAPAAMSALLSAQEHMSEDATLIARAWAVRQIDHVITRVTDTPAITATPSGPDFALTRLMTARQQLRQSYA